MMVDLPEDLAALAKTLTQRFVMHLNGGRNGHTYGYEILNEAGQVVAVKSKWSKKNQMRIVFTMDGVEHDPESFLKAYQQKLRDDEWDAAKPKEQP